MITSGGRSRSRTGANIPTLPNNRLEPARSTVLCDYVAAPRGSSGTLGRISMSSALVNRAVRSLAWPVLKDRGFSCFTSRTAWRDREQLIDIINFQSFNRYNADVLGCTTFSFAVNLSIYLADVPSDHPLPIRNEQLRPAEYNGHIRRRLLPGHPGLPKARDVWFVDEHGHNTSDVVAQAADALTETAEPWFAAFGDPRPCFPFCEASQRRPTKARGYPALRTPRHATHRSGTWRWRSATGDRCAPLATGPRAVSGL